MRASVIRVGTRASQLALAQTGLVVDALKKRNPSTRFKIIPIHSEGDRDRSFGLFKSGQVGVFTKALEDKLLSGEIDVAVHSLKDLPTTIHKKLLLVAFPRRASACDVLVSAKRSSLQNLPAGSVVGTGSPRRKQQIIRLRPDITVADLRGNLDTRIKRALKRDGLDAVLVAEAGLERIDRYQRYAHRLKPDLFLPAVGQGALALEVRRSDIASSSIIKKINHIPTEIAVSAERAFLKELRGGCRVPVGVHVAIVGASLSIRAAVFSVKSNDSVSAKMSGPVTRRIQIARALAQKLLKMGGRHFLREARS
jgi:hydroxymethylbilane synthase